jgi:hypothetical protein
MGATLQDWVHFSQTLKLTADLLPCVSAQANVQIDATSSLSELGKVPSRITAKGFAVGIPAWTSRISTQQDVEAWAGNTNYGICLQTRRVRAIDIDVVDSQLSNAIKSSIENTLGVKLASRTRANSGKQLLVFKLSDPETLNKIILRLPKDEGIIEILGDGQQFIAAGMHTSNVVYEWMPELPIDIPVITREQLNDVIENLTFSLDATKTATNSRALPNVKTFVTDIANVEPFLSYLKDTGRVKSNDNSGKHYVTCAWEEEHSNLSLPSDTSTVYYPVGVASHPLGGFKCLHAHCADKNLHQYMLATGYLNEGFEVSDIALDIKSVTSNYAVPIVTDETIIEEDTTTPTLKNIHRIILAKFNCQFDNFMQVQTLDQKPLTEGLFGFLRMTLETSYRLGKVNERDLKRALYMIQEQSTFDSAITLMQSLPEWDKVPRIDTFFSTYVKAQDTAYTRACGRYLFTALAGRASTNKPIQTDMAIILIGKQGYRKSTAVEAIALHSEHYGAIDLDLNNADINRLVRGKLIVEIPELVGMNRADMNKIKSFITRTTDSHVAKYSEYTSTTTRRCVLIGTTNEPQMLQDYTGNRRMLPITVLDYIDTAKIKEDRIQLWAEGLYHFKRTGVAYSEANELAAPSRQHAAEQDAWQEFIVTYVNNTLEENFDAQFTPAEVAINAIGIKLAAVTPTIIRRVRSILATTQLIYTGKVYIAPKLRKVVDNT